MNRNIASEISQIRRKDMVNKVSVDDKKIKYICTIIFAVLCLICLICSLNNKFRNEYKSVCMQYVMESATYGCKDIDFEKVHTCKMQDENIYIGSASLQNAFGAWRKVNFSCLTYKSKKGNLTAILEEISDKEAAMHKIGDDKLLGEMKEAKCNFVNVITDNDLNLEGFIDFSGFSN